MITVHSHKCLTCGYVWYHEERPTNLIERLAVHMCIVCLISSKRDPAECVQFGMQSRGSFLMEDEDMTKYERMKAKGLDDKAIAIVKAEDEMLATSGMVATATNRFREDAANKERAESAAAALNALCTASGATFEFAVVPVAVHAEPVKANKRS